jgi:cytochrome P450
MTTTLNSLTTDLDYLAFCEERLQDPYPLYHRLRTEDPVHYCEPMNLWLVTRYEDVLAGLRDPRLSSDRTGMYTQALPEELKVRVQPLLNHVSKWIQLTDEPEHGRLRKLVNAAFTPKMINGRSGPAEIF